VGIGEDVAVTRHNNARAEPLLAPLLALRLLLRLLLAAILAPPAEKIAERVAAEELIVEKLVKRVVIEHYGINLGRDNRDDRRHHLLGDIGKNSRKPL